MKNIDVSIFIRPDASLSVSLHRRAKKLRVSIHWCCGKESYEIVGLESGTGYVSVNLNRLEKLIREWEDIAGDEWEVSP